MDINRSIMSKMMSENREIDDQTNRQTLCQSEEQIYRQTDKQADKQTDKTTDWQRVRLNREGETNSNADDKGPNGQQTNRRTDREMCRLTWTWRQRVIPVSVLPTEKYSADTLRCAGSGEQLITRHVHNRSQGSVRGAELQFRVWVSPVASQGWAGFCGK